MTSRPGALRRVLAGLDLVTHRMALTAGAAFFGASIYITLDVIGRKFFHVSSAVTDEMGGYALAFGSMWALAWTLRGGGHVRIDVLLPMLPRLARIVLDYIALAIMVSFAAVVAMYCWFLMWESFTTDARAMSFLRTPLYVPQGLLALGISMLAVEGTVILLLGIVESVGAGSLVELALGRDDEIVLPTAGETPLL